MHNVAQVLAGLKRRDNTAGRLKWEQLGEDNTVSTYSSIWHLEAKGTLIINNTPTLTTCNDIFCYGPTNPQTQHSPLRPSVVQLI